MKSAICLALAASLLSVALAAAPVASAEGDIPCDPNVAALVKCAVQQVCYTISGNPHCFALTDLPDPLLA